MRSSRVRLSSQDTMAVCARGGGGGSGQRRGNMRGFRDASATRANAGVGGSGAPSGADAPRVVPRTRRRRQSRATRDRPRATRDHPRATRVVARRGEARCRRPPARGRSPEPPCPTSTLARASPTTEVRRKPSRDERRTSRRVRRGRAGRFVTRQAYRAERARHQRRWTADGDGSRVTRASSRRAPPADEISTISESRRDFSRRLSLNQVHRDDVFVTLTCATHSDHLHSSTRTMATAC